MTHTDPYETMTDIAVLEAARDALKRASALPEGTTRIIAWAKFDAHMMELDRRAVRHVLAALRKEEQ